MNPFDHLIQATLNATKNPIPKRRPYSRDKAELTKGIIAARKQGMTTAQIASYMSCNTTVVQEVLRKSDMAHADYIPNLVRSLQDEIAALKAELRKYK